ncbi:hypothetical protein ACLB2K_006989 [Fragaria x ananassa]
MGQGRYLLTTDYSPESEDKARSQAPTSPRKRESNSAKVPLAVGERIAEDKQSSTKLVWRPRQPDTEAPPVAENTPTSPNFTQQMARSLGGNSPDNETHFEPHVPLDDDQDEGQEESFTCNMVEVSAWLGNEEVNCMASSFAKLEGERGEIEAPLTPVREQFSFQVGMVFFISERYALPPNTTCNAADILDTSNNVCDMSPPCSSEMGQVKAEPARAPLLEATSIVSRIPTLTFSTPTLDMATHMRPLYISAEVEGTIVNKVMVDTGAAVNVITTRTMGLLHCYKNPDYSRSLAAHLFSLC